MKIESFGGPEHIEQPSEEGTERGLEKLDVAELVKELRSDHLDEAAERIGESCEKEFAEGTAEQRGKLLGEVVRDMTEGKYDVVERRHGGESVIGYHDGKIEINCEALGERVKEISEVAYTVVQLCAAVANILSWGSEVIKRLPEASQQDIERWQKEGIEMTLDFAERYNTVSEQVARLRQPENSKLKA